MSAVDRTLPLKQPDKLFIGGNWRAASGGSLDIISPATEERFATVAAASAEDIDRAVAAAREAFDTGPWPRMTHAERAAYLNEIARLLDARAADVAFLWPNEMGILHSLASMYAGGVGGIYRYYAGLADSFPFFEEHVVRAEGRSGLLVREPVGVVGAIIPWNGPIALIAVKLAPALLSGCTVVIKASPEAPGHALLMAEIAEAAGLPSGVINVVTADRGPSEALVRNPGVDKISFTGSSVAGMNIASVLGGRMARYTMELGGKSAALILDDYDVAAAARTIAAHAPEMTGQVCASITRVVVAREQHDRMLEALSAELAATRVGDPFDPASQMGPLASGRQWERVERYIASGRADGFTLATGGKRPAHLDRGYYVEPTVFGHVDNRAAIAREEIFGPVIAVIPADDEAQAVAIANDSPFGLNATVFTHDRQRAYDVARQLHSGTVGHNSVKMDFDIAFGGFKQSGVGREGGIEGLRPYLESKTILLDHPSASGLADAEEPTGEAAR